jgi:hypothetical protein
MSDQLKTIFIKAKFNFVILGIILLIAILGKITNPELSNTVFLAADQLASNLYLILIAITLGAFVSNFKLVAFGSIGVFVATAALAHLDVFHYFTIEYLFAALIVTLGFAAIANLYRHYREYGL